MMGIAIVEYFGGRLYENPLIRIETLNSDAGIDLMRKYYFVFVGIIKSSLFHDIYNIFLVSIVVKSKRSKVRWILFPS